MARKTLRVLVAEGTATETVFTLRGLCAKEGRPLELRLVRDPSKLGPDLLEFQPDVAFLSLDMLQPEPVESISLLHRLAPHIPLILTALPVDKVRAAECLQSGAKDYMLEGYMDGATLDRVLKTATQQHPANSAPAIPASWRDPVTSLPNRSGLFHHLGHRFGETPYFDSCVIFSARVNDMKLLQLAASKSSLDRNLQQIAERLLRSVRRSDLVAHVGKGVFVIIANASDTAAAVLERRVESSLMAFSQRPAGGLSISFSIQNSFWRSSSPLAFREVLSRHLKTIRRPQVPLAAAVPVERLSAAAARGGK